MVADTPAGLKCRLHSEDYCCMMFQMKESFQNRGFCNLRCIHKLPEW